MSHSNKESVGAREAREARERGEIPPDPRDTTIAALRADLAAKEVEIARLRTTAREVVNMRKGEFPAGGWLPDNDDSRAALERLAAALKEPPHAE